MRAGLVLGHQYDIRSVSLPCATLPCATLPALPRHVHHRPPRDRDGRISVAVNALTSVNDVTNAGIASTTAATSDYRDG